jgi:hypothetical protein
MTGNDTNAKGNTMSSTAQAKVKEAIAHAESFSAFLRPSLRKDIALGQVAMWARMQDSEPSAKLFQTVVSMSDAIVSHYANI